MHSFGAVQKIWIQEGFENHIPCSKHMPKNQLQQKGEKKIKQRTLTGALEETETF